MFTKQKLPSILGLAAIAATEITPEQLTDANAELDKQNVSGVRLVMATDALENPFASLQEDVSEENLATANTELKKLGVAAHLVSQEDLQAFAQMQEELKASGFDSIADLTTAKKEADEKIAAFPGTPPSGANTQGNHPKNEASETDWNDTAHVWNKTIDDNLI